MASGFPSLLGGGRGGVSYSFYHLLEIKLTVISIHLRQLLFQLSPVALAQASHDDQLLQLAGFLAFCHLEDHVNTLLFGVADESAGVDNADLSFRLFRVMHATPSASF